MQPLQLKAKCYKCHTYKVFKLGDIVGGLGVHVDLAVYSELKQQTVKTHFISYFGLWLIGTLGILVAGKHWKFFLKERDELHERLNEMATHDPMTGLWNRHQLSPIFATELARAKRNKQPLSILMVDIDNFKSINDSYGHLAGDKAIKTMAALLGEKLRDSDYMIRYGGDEFLILLPDSDHRHAIEKAEFFGRLIESLQVDVADGQSLSTTLSIGVSTYPEHGKTKEALIDAADGGLYLAKERGRNQVSSAQESSE